MKNTFLVGSLSLVALFAAPVAHAQVVIGGDLFVAQTGTVTATYLGNSASYSNDLYLDSPANALGIIFNNHASPIGTQVNLGTFTAGTELVFRLFVNDTEESFFTGAASRNPDGDAHARITYDFSPTETLVEFEDLFDGPFSFNDLSFSFTNLMPGAAVPEPGSVALLVGMASVSGMMLRRRRK